MANCFRHILMYLLREFDDLPGLFGQFQQLHSISRITSYFPVSSNVDVGNPPAIFEGSMWFHHLGDSCSLIAGGQFYPNTGKPWGNKSRERERLCGKKELLCLTDSNMA